jgi:hypothetical protein
MRVTTTIILLMIFTRAFSQIDFESDKNKSYLHPEFSNQIDSFYKDFDFQFRFWIDGSLLRMDKKVLFIMTQENGKWVCVLYKFAYSKKNQSYLKRINKQIENCDSIWNYFMQNNIIDLPDMHFLKNKFNGDTSKIVIADGLTYSFEFIKRDKYKKLEYHCPVTYCKSYPQIPELLNISNIVKLIYLKIGYGYDPC